ncbi:leucine-rich repeat domain-containing protein [Clostridium felsineum]|uniref:Uncharacterized protein n=1 Tax=Clostridium felsineum TaxID=36839 RepID=A0A1S8LWW0_9CLOT|nr:hypothetical protein CLROS_037620 [Clostridium felsineum]URZ13411.1 hypothetical protein CROST_041770 [Clostridium felsineum]
MKKFKLKCLITAFVCLASVSALNNANTVKADTNDTSVSVTYDAHVQNIGWQNPWAKDGSEAGTDGQALRVEALKIKLVNAPAGAKISYQTHVQNVGWQNWVSDGIEAGTDGKALRVEAFKIKLENMPDYSIQYQAHVENVGWQDWVSDGAEAGTDGKGLRVEAIRVRLVKKVHPNSISINKATDNLKIGDTDTLKASFSPDNTTNKDLTWTSSNSNIVSVDNSGNIKALANGTASITATSNDGQKTASCFVTVGEVSPGVQYQTHVENIGWQVPVSDGIEAGTEGKSLRVEALKINLVNAPADAKIVYQTHVQNIGWQNWVENGNEAGTDGKALRVEALKIKLQNMPGYSIQYQAYIQNLGWQNWVSDGAEAGTDGQNLRIEAIKIKLIKPAAVDSVSLNKTTDTLNIGDSDTLSATVNPSSVPNKAVSWASSDSSIVSVDANGKITANKAGTATITATSVDGNKAASCTVNVNDKSVVTFKDPCLETAVRDALKKPSGPIYSAEVANITCLNASGGAIVRYTNMASLDGIQYLTNLQELRLANDKLTDISAIKDLKNLKTLDLCNTPITDISPIKGLSSLTSLQLDNVNITDITPIRNLTNLQNLSISRCGLSNITALSDLKNLQSLNLGYNNNISNFSPLASLSNLSTLDLEYCNFSDTAPLANLKNLQSLYLGNNKLTDLHSINNLNNLKLLYANNNQINDISSINNLTNLNNLDISSNNITDISSIKGLTNLSNLSVSHNQIKDISPATSLVNLLCIDVSDNPISDVTPLKSLTNLQKLFIDTNKSDLDALKAALPKCTINYGF